MLFFSWRVIPNGCGRVPGKNGICSNGWDDAEVGVVGLLKSSYPYNLTGLFIFRASVVD